MAIDISPAAQAARQEQLRQEQMLRNEQFTYAQFCLGVVNSPSAPEEVRAEAAKVLTAFLKALQQ
jgi:hypothetical protein